MKIKREEPRGYTIPVFLLLGVLLFFVILEGVMAAKANPATGAWPDAVKTLSLGDVRNISWRLRIVEAATVQGDMVTLGEIATPVGNIPAETWKRLSAMELWEAPGESGKPMNLTRPRLQQVMLGSMGRDFASLCLYPPSLVIQRGGSVLGAAEVQEVVVKSLTPMLATLPGEAMLSDFRLPGTVFLQRSGQYLALDLPQSVSPGRLSLRLEVREPDGSVARKLTGTVMIECWASVPCAAVQLNRGDVLDPSQITFIRKNLAVNKGEIWDGKGGPWRLTRALMPGDPIGLTDLTWVPTVSKGSRITLIYQSNSVRLAVRAEALADGVKGESIPVRNLASKKQIYATVWDGGTAVIESGFSRLDKVDLSQLPEEPANKAPQGAFQTSMRD